MKLRIIRKWSKLAHSYAKNSYKTKDGLYVLVSELTPKQEWLLYHKHREDYRKYVVKLMVEAKNKNEED